MKKRKLVFAITAITVFSAMMLTSNTKAQAAAKKTYTITPKSSPYKGKYKKAKGYYNSTTKQYFAIRSYLELLENTISIFYGITQVMCNHDRCQFLFFDNFSCQLHDQFCCLWIKCSSMFIQN